MQLNYLKQNNFIQIFCYFYNIKSDSLHGHSSYVNTVYEKKKLDG